MPRKDILLGKNLALAPFVLGFTTLTAVFILRGMAAPFSHPLFTSMTGIGLGWSRQSRSGLVKFAMPIVGLMISLEAFLGGLLAMVIYWIGLAIVTSALSGIFRTALYLYAAEGRSPEGFSADFVQHAFAPKGGKAAALQTV